MGGAVSIGHDNDDLIDKLKDKEYIRTVEVEKVFRMVDRAHYYLEENRETAYEDVAWKNGLLHMSAPCIYSKVMEALELGPGMSFLNLGSGTGYLNTLVGFMIGPYGINHGIELHADNVAYAKERLQEFMQSAQRFDDLELCEPKFVVGNCLDLSAENRLYDRMYCGAACPLEQKDTLQNMIKVGGILVTPVGDQLLKVKRVSATSFTEENILPVSFASLILPGRREAPDETIVMPEVNPLSLQCISRIVIRNAIRSTFEFTLPVAKTSKSKRRKAKKAEKGRSPRFEDFRSFNVVPTRDGIVVMGFGGRGGQHWSQQVLPGSQRPLPAALRSGVDSSTDDDDNDDDDDDDDNEEEVEEEEDEDFLDRQLFSHANALRIMREGSDQSSRMLSKLEQDIDSDSSDNEEDQKLSQRISRDVNGNSTSGSALASSSSQAERTPEAGSEKRRVCEDDGPSSSQQERSHVLTPRKKKKVSVAKRLPPEDVSPSHSSSNPTKSYTDGGNGPDFDVKTGVGEACAAPEGTDLPRLDQTVMPCEMDLEEKSAQQNGKGKSGRKPYWEAHSSSLSSDEGVILPTETSEAEMEVTHDASYTKGPQSLGIDVPAGGAPSQPCKIQKQVSYSTSADTSETSGFGSLGDDPALLSESLKESPGSLSSEIFPTSLLGVDTSSGTRSRSAGDRTENLSDFTWMDIEEEQGTSEDVTAPPDEAPGSSRDPAASDGEGPSLPRDLNEEGAEDESANSDADLRHMLSSFSKLVKRVQSNSSSEDSDELRENEESGGESAEESARQDDSDKAPDFSSFLKEKVNTLPIPNAIKAFVLHYR